MRTEVLCAMQDSLPPYILFWMFSGNTSGQERIQDFCQGRAHRDGWTYMGWGWLVSEICNDNMQHFKVFIAMLCLNGVELCPSVQTLGWRNRIQPGVHPMDPPLQVKVMRGHEIKRLNRLPMEYTGCFTRNVMFWKFVKNRKCWNKIRKTFENTKHRDIWISGHGLFITQMVFIHIGFKIKGDFRTYPNERTNGERKMSSF